METVLLKSRQLVNFEPVPQQSHPRLSLRRVVWVKILRWIDKSSPQAIWKVARWGLMSLLVSFLWFMPEATFQLTLHVVRWNSGRIPLFLGLLWTMLNAKRLYLWLKRKNVRHRGANQHTYHGLPVGEFASFLLRTNAFKFADATKELALTRDQYDSIAEELEKHGVLTRGEKNARVLRPIGMKLLVEQLRDNFPYAWDEDTDTWHEKNGTFARWCMNQDFERKKLSEKTERAKNQLAKVKEQIAEASSNPVFASMGL